MRLFAIALILAFIGAAATYVITAEKAKNDRDTYKASWGACQKGARMRAAQARRNAKQHATDTLRRDEVHRRLQESAAEETRVAECPACIDSCGGLRGLYERARESDSGDGGREEGTLDSSRVSEEDTETKINLPNWNAR